MTECNIVGKGGGLGADGVEELVRTKSKWEELARITTSGTWTVPEGVYRIGVFLLGAGSSGEADIISKPSSSFSTHRAAGGASGWGLSVALDVTPGQSFAVEIGAGGVATDRYRAQGGDTKFGTFVAAGGGTTARHVQGVQDMFGFTFRGSTAKETLYEGPYGGVSTLVGVEYSGDNSYYSAWASAAAPNEKNTFDPTMKLFGLGGGLLAYMGSNATDPVVNRIKPADLGPMGSGGEATLVSSSISGVTYHGMDATGYGNGGGGCLSRRGVPRGGTGSPGIIIIYV